MPFQSGRVTSNPETDKLEYRLKDGKETKVIHTPEWLFYRLIIEMSFSGVRFRHLSDFPRLYISHTKYALLQKFINRLLVYNPSLQFHLVDYGYKSNMDNLLEEKAYKNFA